MADREGGVTLISDEYREAQTTLHENENYGVASLTWASRVWEVIERTGVEEILDYGCGKGRLAQGLSEHVTRDITVYQYDPAIEEVSGRPEPAQMVVCLDVLEHIEPDCLDEVLDDIQSLTLKYAFLTISTVPAQKVLPDGRNAHLIQEGIDFWLPKLWKRFRIMSFVDFGHTLVVTVEKGAH